MKIHPIICNNNTQKIIEKMQDYLNTGAIIKNMKVVDQTEQQIIILLSNEEINQAIADAWWSGYTNAIGALN